MFGRIGIGLALLFVLGRDAAAQTVDPRLPLPLEWSAPAGCPSGEHVREMLLTILGGTSAPPGGIVVRAVAESAPGGRWRVSLSVEGRGESGHRQLEAESCAAAADAAVLIAAMMIDPAHDAESPVGASGPAPPVAAVTVPVASPLTALEPPRVIIPPIEAPRTRRSAAWPHLAARLAVGGDIGTLSRTAVAGELLVAASIRHLRVELAGTYWPTVRASRSGRPDEGVDLAFGTLGLRGAYLFEVQRRFIVAPLVGIEADRVTGAGFGGAQDLPQTALWAAVDAGGMVAWSLGGRFSLSLTLEGMVPTSRPPFVALEPPPSPPSIVLQRVSPVIGRSFLGVECRFF